MKTMCRGRGGGYAEGVSGVHVGCHVCCDADDAGECAAGGTDGLHGRGRGRGMMRVGNFGWGGVRG